MTFFAHSGDDTSPGYHDWQPLKDHLRAVACAAAARARLACPHLPALGEAARAAGLLHDLGKYRPGFQQHLRGVKVPPPTTWHKQAGAALAAGYPPVAAAIAGHHGGMPDGVELKNLIRGPHGQAVADAVWADAVGDCPDLAGLEVIGPEPRNALQPDLFTRILFSCLVDADWADTGAHDRQVHGLPPEPPPPALDARAWLAHVLAFIAGKATACRDAHVGRVRAEVLHACLAAAEGAPGVFSLTVPTGGGKTLAGLAFALKHAQAHGLRRIIYVAPYLSILDQNAGVIREALGADEAAVFEHHSLAEPASPPGEEATRRTAAARRAESWDAPVVLTTSVQFYESLFANQPSRCRKLHNVARGVILLDECQTLPPELAALTWAMLKQLAEDLGATVVLCTATQPAFNHASLKEEERLPAREIIPAGLELFVRLKRVTLAWPQAGERLDWPAVAEAMAEAAKARPEGPAALCVVNTRKAARDLFHELARRQGEGVFHLSTSMCPAHRMQVLEAVRRHLDSHQPCLLVSTQLIEAGVDVDFPCVFREMAPLESILQAAGRCNREGLLSGPGGRVVVFRSVEGKLPPDGWYQRGTQTVEHDFLAAGRPPRIDEPADITEYFTRLYHNGSLDQHHLQAARRRGDFATIAAKYRLIDDGGVPVVVATWEGRRDEVDALLDRVRIDPSRANFRKLHPFQVNLRPDQLAQAGGAAVQLDPRLDLLVWHGAYNPALGLSPDQADALLVV